MRSLGQQCPVDGQPPVFGPCRLLDFELEVAFVTFEGKPLGESISTAEVAQEGAVPVAFRGSSSWGGSG